MKAHIARMLLLFTGITLFGVAQAQTEATMTDKRDAGQSLSDPISHDLCHADSLAIGGYDLVSYRQASGPLVGSEEFNADYEGLKYRFISDSNRSAFLKEPEKYLPQYNGFCAVTLALGRVTCPQYDNFKIEDDKLFLFEVTGFTNGRTLWNSAPADFRIKADNNFIQIAQ